MKKPSKHELPLTLKLSTEQKYAEKGLLNVVRYNKYNFGTETTDNDRTITYKKLQTNCFVRNFFKTPSKKIKSYTNTVTDWAINFAQEKFDLYLRSYDVIPQLPPYEYRTAICSSLAEVEYIQITVNHQYNKDLIKTAATMVWIELTRLFEGLFGEKLDRDYIHYLDRNQWSNRLRHHASYDQLNHAYCYANQLDYMYPVEDKSKWVDYPQSWGELIYCCLWRKQQSQFFVKRNEYFLKHYGPSAATTYNF